LCCLSVGGLGAGRLLIDDRDLIGFILGGAARMYP
jgi:hypothetical protein